ncbi:MAG: SdpI family protein [Lachnospiraceae bacterium]|nr:SdpI family protein [Lachnospiraceae bacterium]
MTKTKKNVAVGVRTTWSMYNDNTWRKSNRFGAISLMVAVVIVLIYSKKVYQQEKSKEKQELAKQILEKGVRNEI